MLNSDGEEYWGTGVGNAGGVMAEDAGSHGRPHALSLRLPPLGTRST
jgi:1,4-alpha-glucan branching enzyme